MFSCAHASLRGTLEVIIKRGVVLLVLFLGWGGGVVFLFQGRGGGKATRARGPGRRKGGKKRSSNETAHSETKRRWAKQNCMVDVDPRTSSLGGREEEAREERERVVVVVRRRAPARLLPLPLLLVLVLPLRLGSRGRFFGQRPAWARGGSPEQRILQSRHRGVIGCHPFTVDVEDGITLPPLARVGDRRAHLVGVANVLESEVRRAPTVEREERAPVVERGGGGALVLRGERAGLGEIAPARAAGAWATRRNARDGRAQHRARAAAQRWAGTRAGEGAAGPHEVELVSERGRGREREGERRGGVLF